MKRSIYFITSVGAGLCVFLLPLNLLPEAKLALCGMAAAIVLWISRPFPEYVTALLLSVYLIAVCQVPMNLVFGAFSKPTLWLLLCAFGLSLGISRCGLLDRMAQGLLRFCDKSYTGRVLGLAVTVLVCSPFIPSMSAKAAVFAPLCQGVSALSGYPDKSRPAAGLFLAMLTTLRSTGPLFISASVNGYALRSLMPETYAAEMTLVRWFIAALPWFLLVTFMSLSMILLLFHPKREKRSVEPCQKKALPPMTIQQRGMALIMTGTLLLWITEPLHGLAAHIVAILALCLTIGCNILPSRQFITEMNWHAIIFIGLVLELSAVFSYLGISEVLMQTLTPALAQFNGHPLLFILLTALVTILMRLIIVSEIALINLFMVILLPLTMALGLHPWVACISVYAVVCTWFFSYQSPVYLAACYASDDNVLTPRKAFFSCAVYMIFCILALAACIPYWKSIGLLYL